MSKEIAARLGVILSSGRDPHSKLDEIKQLAEELEDSPPWSSAGRFTFTRLPEPEGRPDATNAKVEGATPTGYPERPKVKAKPKSAHARVKPAATKYRRS